MPRLIDKRCAIKHLKELLKHSIMPTEWYEGAKSAITLLQKEQTVDAEPVVRCKDCKYFHYNKAYNIQGFPIMGNLVCDKWGNGCRTDENGYCFLGERREDAEKID